MRRIDIEILVIGGGATGAGILRDLAMRGFKAVLVEKGDLSHGTTGRYHGLLHSGGRYVVKDPKAAKECIEENRILRRIMPQCIEDTGGFFVVTQWDDPAYAPRFAEGCRAAGIPVEKVAISEMLRAEPLLNPNISQCFHVPDGSADSFLATELNIASAQQYGAQVFTYHPVVRLLTTGDSPITKSGFRVAGAVCYDRVRDEEVAIHADLVVNAAGAWAGLIAETVGIKVHIVPGKGTMLATNHRIINTVVNRCKMPSDGDILVPIHTVTVIGTTDVKVKHPDHFAIEPWEVNLCLEEGDKLVPGFSEMRILRAWAGVRPLYQESEVTDTRDITRSFVLLDHETRDGVAGLMTITSGKWTTYRKMAEVTVDLVCSKLGVQRPCRTHLEAVPDTGGHTGKGGFYYVGGRLASVEAKASFGDLVCECELASLADVEAAILSGHSWTLDDIRKDVRLGMGPCQGGFCTYRAAGLVHQLSATGRATMAAVYAEEGAIPPDAAGASQFSTSPKVATPNHLAVAAQTNLALRDFLQERWKGLMPILWGQQLRQERLDELVYQSVLNADHLPGPHSGRLSPVLYGSPTEGVFQISPDRKKRKPHSPVRSSSKAQLDVLVVGSGLSGLFSAWLAAQSGQHVRLVTKGWGALYWNAGTIDVLGYYPLDREEAVGSPAAAVRQLIREHPGHPYALAGIDHLRRAIEAIQELCNHYAYPLFGSLERNWLLPSALGTLRPTCLAPGTMIAGDLRQPGEMLLVGFKHYLDFYPYLAADNLVIQGFEARGVLVDLPSFEKRRFVNARVIADACASPAFVDEIAAQVKPHLTTTAGRTARVGLPAVLGFGNAIQVQERLQDTLGVPVFEIPTLPPSIPGIRLHHLLVKAIETAGGRVYDGMQAAGFEADGNRITQVFTEAAARQKSHSALRFILATGGILGGGLGADYTGKTQETLFNLPLPTLPGRTRWLEEEFLSPGGHPIFRQGVRTDRDLRPVDISDSPVYTNLQVVGGALGGAELVRERSLEGVALATAYQALEAAIRQ